MENKEFKDLSGYFEIQKNILFKILHNTGISKISPVLGKFFSITEKKR